MRRPAIAYAIGVISVLAGLGARMLLWPVLGPEFPFLLFFGAVMVTAWSGGLGPGLLATFLSAVVSVEFLLADKLAAPRERVPTLVALAGFVVVGCLISALSEALHRLRRRQSANEERLRQVIENTPAPIAMVDTELRYIVVSRRWLSDYRLAETDVIGRGHYAVFPEIPVRWKEIHRRCLAGATEKCDEDPFPRADGTTDWIKWEVQPWRDDRGAIGGLVFYSEVITERKNAAEAREQHARELERALEARDAFLSIASHELRTPLTPLLLQLESLRHLAEKGESALAPGKLVERLGKATRQAIHLARLVETLLDVSKITAGRVTLDLADVDLAALVAEATERMRPELEAASCTVTSKVDRPVVGRWDRARLDQVVTNLLANAIKYGQGRPIELDVAESGSDAALVVRDHGIGISPEDQTRIFGRFERAVSDRNYGGFGLGLWIAKEVVVALGGRIEVSSALGEGATFRVTLPKAGPER